MNLHRNRIYAIIFSISLLFSTFTGTLPVLAETTGPEISAPSAILMEASTGTILYEKNAYDRNGRNCYGN